MTGGVAQLLEGVARASKMRQWKPISNNISGLMRGFSESIGQMELRHPDFLPDLRRGPVIFIGSDYSGQHDLTEYETFTFLFADLENCRTWEKLRRDFRKEFLRDGRRISYKGLNDRKLRKALLPFLYVADSIPGLVVTILVHKTIESLFEPIENAELQDSPLKDYKHWKRPVFEKLLRIIHFAGLFLSGLSNPYQNVIWITDEDEIVPNDERLREAVNLFGVISSQYLNHTLGHFRWGTTKLDSEERQLEDIVSVADLVAGALSSVLSNYKKQGCVPKSEFIVPPPQNLPRKTKEIMDWFSDNTRILKRVVYSIEPLQSQTGFNLKHLRFHGSNDLAF